MLDRPQATFIDRTHCINCGSSSLSELSNGRYSDEPLRSLIANDPWGEMPLPYLQDAVWRLMQCVECAQVFHRHALSEEWNERRFSTWMSAEAIKAFEDKMGANAPSRLFDRGQADTAHILRIEKLTRPLRQAQEPVRLLDFGCGFGGFVQLCLQFGFDAVGVDRASARADGAAFPILQSLDDLGDAPPFHAVTLFEVLEHLDDPAAVLRELHAAMVPGGILVLETPDCSGVRTIQSRHDYLSVHPLDHINAFTHSTLKSIAERCGFMLTPRGSAHVTTNRLRILKREASRILSRDGRSTRLYFRRSDD